MTGFFFVDSNFAFVEIWQQNTIPSKPVKLLCHFLYNRIDAPPFLTTQLHKPLTQSEPCLDNNNSRDILVSNFIARKIVSKGDGLHIYATDSRLNSASSSL